MLIVLSVASGWIGWSGNVLALPVAMLFPALWAHSTSRTTAALVSAGYFLAASRGLPLGVANFYAADMWPGLLLWLGASLSFIVVHAVAWAKHPNLNRAEGQPKERRPARWLADIPLAEKGLAMRYLVASLLMALPPFGIMGWAHPLTAAGVLFPGWGWWGLGATAILLVVMTGRRWLIAVAVLGGLHVWSATTWTPPKVPDRWTGVDLQHGENLGRDNSLDHYRDLIATVRAAAAPGTLFVVLPESALGFWTPTVAQLWQQGLRGSNLIVIAGAAVIDAGGYDNVIVAISAGEAQILYRERMPVPISMWQPWRKWTAQGGAAIDAAVPRRHRGDRQRLVDRGNVDRRHSAGEHRRLG